MILTRKNSRILPFFIPFFIQSLYHKTKVTGLYRKKQKQTLKNKL